MAFDEEIGERRRAHRATPKPSTTSVRQNVGILYLTHGQSGDRGTRSSGGFVLGNEKSTGKQNPSRGIIMNKKMCFFRSIIEVHEFRPEQAGYNKKISFVNSTRNFICILLNV